MVAVVEELTLQQIRDVGMKASSRALISSAFCKREPFELLCKSTSLCQEKAMIVRWQFCDLISGASDLEIFDVAQQYGYRLYFNQQLHAKVYLFDEEIFLGSSNLTNKGLCGGPHGNIEMSVKISKSTFIQNWFKRLIEASVYVDKYIFNAITEDVGKYKQTQVFLPPTRKGFSQSVLNEIKSQHNPKGIYLSDFPLSSDPNMLCVTDNIYDDECVIHDLNLFGLHAKPDITNVKKAFILSACYSWLYSAVDGPIYFGELTSKLHDSLCDEKHPYRKEVKERLSNLIFWGSSLCPETFVVDRPKHSQRITKLRTEGE